MSKLPRRSKKAKLPTAPPDAPASPKRPAKAKAEHSTRAHAKPKPPARVHIQRGHRNTEK